VPYVNILSRAEQRRERRRGLGLSAVFLTQAVSPEEDGEAVCEDPLQRDSLCATADHAQLYYYITRLPAGGKDKARPAHPAA
jgi:hypothetical protein